MTTTAQTTAPAEGAQEIQDAGDVDVLIVGAGVSGIGAAHHLRDQLPDRTFVILDSQPTGAGPGGPISTRACALTATCSPTATGSSRGADRQSRRARRFSPTSTRSLTKTTSASTFAISIALLRPPGPPRTAGGPSRSPGPTLASNLRFTTGFLWMCQGFFNHAQPYRPRWEGMGPLPGRVGPSPAMAGGSRPSRASTLRRHWLRRHRRDTETPGDRRAGGARDHAGQRSPSYYFGPSPTTNELAVDAARGWISPRSGTGTRSCAVTTSSNLTGWPRRRWMRPMISTLSLSSPCARCCPRACDIDKHFQPPLPGPWQHAHCRRPRTMICSHALGGGEGPRS